MTELPLDGLLSVEDVARFMSVSTKTVRRMMSRGELVTHRFGRSVRVDASSVTSLLAGSVTSTAVETVAMNDKKKSGHEGGPVYRQRGSEGPGRPGRRPGGAARHDEREGGEGGSCLRSGRPRRARRSWRGLSPLTRSGFAVISTMPRAFAACIGSVTVDVAGQHARRRMRTAGTATMSGGWAGASMSVRRGPHWHRDAHVRAVRPNLDEGRARQAFPDHVKRKRTAKGDQQRLKLYCPR